MPRTYPMSCTSCRETILTEAEYVVVDYLFPWCKECYERDLPRAKSCIDMHGGFTIRGEGGVTLNTKGIFSPNHNFAVSGDFSLEQRAVVSERMRRISSCCECGEAKLDVNMFHEHYVCSLASCDGMLATIPVDYVGIPEWCPLELAPRESWRPRCYGDYHGDWKDYCFACGHGCLFSECCRVVTVGIKIDSEIAYGKQEVNRDEAYRR